MVGVRPVTDTVKRSWTVSSATPSTGPGCSRSPPRWCCRRAVVAALDELPSDDFVPPWSPRCARRFPVELVEAPPEARRVGVGRRPRGCSRRSRARTLQPGASRSRSSGNVILRFWGAPGTATMGRSRGAGEAGGGVGAVEAVGVGPRVRREQVGGPERLRGLHPVQLARPRSAPVERQQPRQRDDRDRAAVLAGGRDGGLEEGRAGQRSGAVVDRDHVHLAGSISGASARSAAHSEACRVAPPSTSPTSRVAEVRRHRGLDGRPRSPGRTTTRTRPYVGQASASRTDQASTGASPSGSSTLLVPAPTRAPVPAARITTAAGTGGV